MAKRKTISLRAFAKSENPFGDQNITNTLIKSLRRQKAEGRLVEWKLHGPFSTLLTKGGKYRIVKAIISFANTEGGFLLFGVGNDGRWVGLSKEDVESLDPSRVTELVNGCVIPDILEFNLYCTSIQRKRFAILHVAPSRLMPHVTTKEIKEQIAGKKPEVILKKYALYCRYGGKSDIARPMDYERIIAARTDHIRQNILRKFKEVVVPAANLKSPISIGDESAVVFKIAKGREGEAAQVVTFTRKKDGTQGVFLHEELSDGLFDEINNIVGANSLLAKGKKKFFFGAEVYYRIYAERQHVAASADELELLARTGFELYGPVLYWLLRLPENRTASIMRHFCDNPKYPKIHSIMKLAILLGPNVTEWLESLWEDKWYGDPQPPSFYFAFRDMRRVENTKERTLVALRAGPNRRLELRNADESGPVSTFMENSQRTSGILSNYCVSVFEGKKDKSICRELDILAYGREMESRGSKISAILASR